MQELNNHFLEMTTNLLLKVACLSRNDSFSTFNEKKILRMTQPYLDDFNNLILACELYTFIA